MALPQLTPEQRAQAGVKATAARKRRAEVSRQIGEGELSIRSVIELSGTDEALAKMRVSAMIEALPGIGKKKSADLMRKLGIAASRRLRGLGPYQRDALLTEFEK